MKRFLLIFALLTYGGCSVEQKPVNKTLEVIVGEISIIPQPNSIKRIGGHFELGAQTRIVAADEFGIRAATVLNEFLIERYGYALNITDQPNFENSITFSTFITGDETYADEAYNLKIEPKHIQISGSERGMFYAVQSLIQLLPLDFFGEIKIPAAEIADAPRFAYRGMHLDVGRHFMPADFIKKYIGLLARYKFNYFHWHLTDDQGWRIEIKKYPRLTDIGSKRRETVVKKNYRPFVGDGIPVEGYYTQEQIRDIATFAKAKHITIIPEIDLPGHSSAALAAYPEFGCKDDYPYRVQTSWGGFPGVLCPTESTFHFIEDVLGEVIELFPYSPYVHIGGDEVMTDHWKESEFVQNLKRRENLKTELDVQSWFIGRVENFVNSRNRKIIVWDEALKENIGTSATIMVWRGFEPGIRAVRAGHQVIMTPSEATYFDKPQSDEKYEPLSLGKRVTTEDVYGFDPIPRELNSEEARRIIGAQGCVWTEFIKRPEQVEYMAFPRALALAEVLWSMPQVKNFDEFMKRLDKEFPRLDREAVNYRIPKPRGLRNRKLSPEEEAVVDLALPIPNGEIYYTINGTNPNVKSNLYREPFLLDVEPNTTVEVRAKVVKSNGRESPVFTAWYIRQTKLSDGQTDQQSAGRSKIKKKNGRNSQPEN